MDAFIDISHDSINKYKEELCGDHVEISKNDNSTIIVLSDGLGSGVKANILSTITATIASTMLKLGSNILSVIETLEATLPECKERHLAYSTFTIIQLFNDGNLYIIEFDNPKYVFIRNNNLRTLKKREFQFKNKKIFESIGTYEIDDTIVAFSDGVIHTGIGRFLNLGWEWNKVSDFLIQCNKKKKPSKYLSKELIDICNTYNGNKPGDDTTCIVVKISNKNYVTLFSGPPRDITKDSLVTNELLHSRGLKIVCGGTAANIIARETKKEIVTDINSINSKIPPIGYLDNIDLVTEGVLTITETVNIINEYLTGENKLSLFNKQNGASMLADILINKCTNIDMLMGNTINPAHQNPYFPDELSIKWRSTKTLIDLLEKIGKEVTIKYF